MSSKQQHTINLHGIKRDASACTTQEASLVSAFVDDRNRSFSAVVRGDIVFLRTPFGHYRLAKHATDNRYQGTMYSGIKVHVVCKAISGKLIYWS